MATSIAAVDAANISPGTGGSIPIGKEINVASRAINGGTLYITTVRSEGNSDPAGVATTFVPTNVAAPTRQLRLSDGKSDLGVPFTAAAGTPSGTLGISRTAGTSMILVGEATSSSAKTDKGIWEFTLPDTYQAGAAITFNVDANYTTSSGAVTAASTTVLGALYTESVSGVEAVATVTQSATQISSTATQYPFTVSATNAATAGLAPGSRVVFEVTLLVTNSSGASTGQVNSITYVA
jgi:hypothetical protein